MFINVSENIVQVGDERSIHVGVPSFTSFDGRCSWTDGSVFPGFSSKEIIFDVSFAIGLDNEVYLFYHKRKTFHWQEDQFTRHRSFPRTPPTPVASSSAPRLFP